jgi:hypothetical protein
MRFLLLTSTSRTMFDGGSSLAIRFMQRPGGFGCSPAPQDAAGATRALSYCSAAPPVAL